MHVQAKNYMKTMKVGDKGFFYHSNAGSGTGIVGTVRVSREAYPDHTAFDKKSKYYDAKSVTSNPKWYMVDIELDEIFPKPVLLHDLKARLSDSNDKLAQRVLSNMPLLQRGSRLSIQPVTVEQWNYIIDLSKKM